MNLPQIRIESTIAKLGLHSEKSVQHIEQPKADLTIEQPGAELSIMQTPGVLTIDQTEAWEQMDLKSIFRRTEEFAENGKSDWLTGMARVAQQGDELMRIEEDGNPFVTQAITNSENPPYEFNIGWIPAPFSVKINYEPGEVNITAKSNRPIIKATANKPLHDYTPGKVNGYMQQYNDLEIDFVNLKG